MSAKTIMRSLSIVILAILCQSIVAQNNYRPASSKSTDHSYFMNGKINIITSSHQDIAWMDSIGACEIWRDENMITPVLKMLAENKSFSYTVEDA
jgi:alpha-mannosidase